MESNKEKERIQKVLCTIAPILGLCFCIWYIFNASYDVVYQDYVRSVNNNIATGRWKSFPKVSTILNGGLVTWVNNWINIKFFSFSTLHDMILGAFGLTMISAVVIKYANDRKIKFGYIFILTCVIFSLNKWEMLLNGTGWIHFFAFGGFYLHFLLFDYVYRNNYKVKKGWRLLLLLCPIINIIFLAGMYCAVYSITCIIFYLFLLIMEKRTKNKWNKELLYDLSSVVIPLIIYIIAAKCGGNSLALGYSFESEQETFFSAFFTNPKFFVKFFVLSFSSMFLGVESMVDSENIQMIIGGIIIFMYILALFLYLKNKLYIETLFPGLLAISGFLNHGIILYSRWRFQSVTYGMSSRYALQYQSGIIGIFLIFYLIYRNKQEVSQKRKIIFISVWAAFTIFIFAGTVRTTLDEIEKAPYRKAYGETLVEIGLNYNNEPDERILLFNADGDASYVRSALQTLQEEKLNIFKDDFYSFTMEDATFEGVQEREDNPWGKSAGIIEVESGEDYIFLTPHAAVSLPVDTLNVISLKYEIYYQVRSNSDGAELKMEFLDNKGKIVCNEEIAISPSEDEKELIIDLTKYESLEKLKLTCNGGNDNNENADWVIIRIAGK